MLQVAHDLLGIHAQVMSCAELALATRVRGLTRADVGAALWSERTLVKTWGMRGTLHLFDARDWPLLSAAMRLRSRHLDEAWLKAFDVTAKEMTAIIAAVPEALDGRALTRAELGEELIRITKATRQRDQLRSGWGSFLKPVAYQGLLCFGPSEGRNVTFVRPDQWLAGWTEHDPHEALAEVLRRYLTTYGPAQREDFARWWGSASKVAREARELLGDEIEDIEVGGVPAWMLAEHAGGLRAGRALKTVRLVGGFDPYVVAAPLIERTRLGDDLRLVSRTAGWISAALLIGGAIGGVWSYERKAGCFAVTVEPFVGIDETAATAISREVARFAGLFGDATWSLALSRNAARPRASGAS